MLKILTNPIGNPTLALLLIRIALGFYYIVLGVWGLEDSEVFLRAIETYANATGDLVVFFAQVSPYILLLSGGLMVLGFLSNLACVLSLIVFTILLLWSGAFALVGDGLQVYIARRSIIKDLVVYVANFSILFSGPGRLSLDGLFGTIYSPDRR